MVPFFFYGNGDFRLEFFGIVGEARVNYRDLHEKPAWEGDMHPKSQTLLPSA